MECGKKRLSGLVCSDQPCTNQLPNEIRTELIACDLVELTQLAYYFAPADVGALQHLAQKAKMAELSRSPLITGVALSRPARTGMTPKKVHEVEGFSALLTQLLPRSTALVDVGCGEGNLTAALSVLCGYSCVVGLEGSVTARPSLGNRLKQLRSTLSQEEHGFREPRFATLVIEDHTTPAQWRAAAQLEDAACALIGTYDLRHHSISSPRTQDCIVVANWPPT